jgi:serine/threonine-protein kinase
MTTREQRWEKIQQVFYDASEMPTSERERFLAQACADDEMLAEVRSMMAHDSSRDDAASVALPNGGLSSMAGVLEDDQYQRELGPYILIRLLGEGGSGRVYLARRADVGSVVAIKILRDAWVSPARKERFADEERIVAQLRHPLIASLYDAGVTGDDTPYFVMEYVDGLPLTRYCANHGCGLRERLEIFLKVCEAVRYSHSQAIAHRDIKPSNILVTADGGVKLLDFGIAKQMESVDENNLSRTGFRLMTPAYASPEQWLGKRPGLQGDIYSLGVVLYELLTGCLPFDLAKVTPSEAERLITQQEPPAPSAIVRKNCAPGVALVVKADEWADLDVICLKAMHKEPERRYATADALMGDVRAFLDGEPVSARPDSRQYRTSKFLRRNRRAAVAVAAMFIVVAVLSVFFVWRLNRERQNALAEAAHAQRILQFTLNLFSADSSNDGQRQDLRASDLLARGMQEAKALQGDPLRQSEIFMTLGSVFQKIGALNNAEAAFHAAWVARSQIPDTARGAAAESLIALGLVHCDQNRFDQAEKEVRAGLATLQNQRDSRDAKVLKGQVSMGHVLTERGSYRAAIKLLLPAVQLQQISGSPDVDRSSGFYELSSAYFYAGDYDRSEHYLSSRLLLDRSMYGALHPEVADDELGLCSIDQERHALVDAERHCRTGVSIDQAWYGTKSPVTASAMLTLGELIQAENKVDEAKALLEQSLQIQQANYGEFHEKVAIVLAELGDNALYRDDYDAAEADYRHALAIYRKLYGDHYKDVAVCLSNIANVANHKKEYGQAETYLRQTVAIYLETQGPEHTDTAMGHLKLGHVLLREKKYAEAKQETQLGYSVLFRHTLPQGDFFDMAKKDLAEEASALKAPPLIASSH